MVRLDLVGSVIVVTQSQNLNMNNNAIELSEGGGPRSWLDLGYPLHLGNGLGNGKLVLELQVYGQLGSP